MRHQPEPAPADLRSTAERIRPLLVLLPSDMTTLDTATQDTATFDTTTFDTTNFDTGPADTAMADLVDRLDSCADLALEAQHELERRENEARKDGDVVEIHRLDALADLFRHRYLALSGLRGALLGNGPSLRPAADRIAAVNTSLTAEIENVREALPSVGRLGSIAADIDAALAVILPLVAAT
jgi:hypothetical protein